MYIHNSTAEDYIFIYIFIYIYIYMTFNFNTSKSLFHSTVSAFDLSKVKYFWTSFDYNQSGLHIFDSKCERYFTNDRYREVNLWPIMFEFNSNKNLILLDLFLNKSSNQYCVKTKIDGIDNNIDLFEYFKDTLNINLNELFEGKRTTFDNTNCKNKYNKECNIKILIALDKFNETSDMKYDGYICENDQKEIALINPYDKLVKINKYVLDGLKINNNNLQKITIYDDTRNIKYYDFLKEFYKNIINIFNDEYRLDASNELLEQCINYDLNISFSNMNTQITRELRRKYQDVILYDESSNSDEDSLSKRRLEEFKRKLECINESKFFNIFYIKKYCTDCFTPFLI